MEAKAPHDEIRAYLRDGIRLLARMARIAEQLCRSVGISLPQYRLLVSISDEPQRASELAAQVGVSRPTLTSLVDGLAQAGLVQRVPVPSDRRGIQLVVTDAGRQAVARAECVIAERIEQLVDFDKTPLHRDVVATVKAALERETASLDACDASSR
jgi:DNA-binding MarR family transcriptional regulator